jgi:hypothetical protein
MLLNAFVEAHTISEVDSSLSQILLHLGRFEVQAIDFLGKEDVLSVEGGTFW